MDGFVQDRRGVVTEPNPENEPVVRASPAVKRITLGFKRGARIHIGVVIGVEAERKGGGD